MSGHADRTAARRLRLNASVLAKSRAYRGWGFIATKLPHRLKNIDLITLDVGSKYRCPLAQAMGSGYGDAQDQLGLSDAQCVEYGFMEDRLVTFAELTAAWQSVLVEAQAKAAA